MATEKAPVSLAFGCGLWSNEASQLSTQRELTEVCREFNIKVLDTSHTYANDVLRTNGESERYLGNAGLSSEFQIITKASMGLVPDGSTKEGILKGWQESQKSLKTDKVAFYLLHVPDENTPISSTMDGIQELYVAGKFETFGLSNFSAAQVEECHAYCISKSYVLPTVYQSVYSLAHRRYEKELFPTLRRLNISIQGYSALATGFLVKTPEDIKNGKGLFDPSTVLGKILRDMYGRPPFLKFLEEYRKLCEEAGCKEAGLAYRWVVWNSALSTERGDCVVLGASSAAQLRNTVEEIHKGPLEDWIVDRLKEMWKSVEADAPGDNFGTFKKLMKAGII